MAVRIGLETARQLLAQRHARAEEPALGCWDGDSYCLRRLFKAELFHVTKNENGPTTRSQTFQSFLQNPLYLASRTLLLWIAVPDSNLSLTNIFDGINWLIQRDRRVAPALAQLHQRFIHRDPAVPGRKLGVSLEARQMLISFQERFLKNVLGVMVILRDPFGEAIDSAVVPIYQVGKRIGVPLSRSGDKRALFLGEKRAFASEHH